MATFITIGYGDQRGYDGTEQAVLDEAHAHDSTLLERGGALGVADTPVQVRNHDGAGIETEAGAFMQAALPLAGFAVLEAESIEEAIEMVARTPCAVAHGVVEVWPLKV